MSAIDTTLKPVFEITYSDFTKIERQEFLQNLLNQLLNENFEPSRKERALSLLTEANQLSSESNLRIQKTRDAITSLFNQFLLSTVSGFSIKYPFHKDEGLLEQMLLSLQMQDDLLCFIGTPEKDFSAELVAYSITMIASGLLQPKTLRLELYTSLTDELASKITRAIAYNDTIEKCDLHFKNWQRTHLMPLCEALRKNQTIKKITLVNIDDSASLIRNCVESLQNLYNIAEEETLLSPSIILTRK